MQSNQEIKLIQTNIMKTFFKILYFVISVILLKNFCTFFFGANTDMPMAILGWVLYILVFAPMFIWGWNRIKKNKK